MGQYQSIYNGSQIDDCVSQAVRTIVQQLTDEQKAQVRTNIGAGTYSIPSGGIPRTSLTTDVQTSLSKADNALPLSGGNVSGELKVLGLKIERTNEINSYDGANNNLHLNLRSSGYVSICNGGGNVVIGASTDYGYQLYVNGRIAGSNLCLSDGGRINVKDEPSGSTFFIGNSGNQGWVRLQDMCSQAGTAGDESGWSIRTNGRAIFVSVTQTSDVRKKNIIENINISAKDISNAPIFRFTWIDPKMPKGLNVGTSAQYWKTIIPEIVSEMDDGRTLSMQYGVAGLISSVVLARKIVEQDEEIKLHNTRIKALEKIIGDIQSELSK